MHFMSMSSMRKKKTSRILSETDINALRVAQETGFDAMADTELGVAISHDQRDKQDKRPPSSDVQLPESDFRVSCFLPALQSRFPILQEGSMDTLCSDGPSDVPSMGKPSNVQHLKLDHHDPVFDFGFPDGLQTQDGAGGRSHSRPRVAFESIPEENERVLDQTRQLAQERLTKIQLKLAALSRPDRPHALLRARHIAPKVPMELLRPPTHVPAYTMHALPPVPHRAPKATVHAHRKPASPPPITTQPSHTLQRQLLGRPSTGASAAESRSQNVCASLDHALGRPGSGASAAFGPLPILPSLRHRQAETAIEDWPVPPRISCRSHSAASLKS